MPITLQPTARSESLICLLEYVKPINSAIFATLTFKTLFLITAPAVVVPINFAPAKSSSNCAARADAIPVKAGSVPRSILREASLDNPCKREFLATLFG